MPEKSSGQWLRSNLAITYLFFVSHLWLRIQLSSFKAWAIQDDVDKWRCGSCFQPVSRLLWLIALPRKQLFNKDSYRSFSHNCLHQLVIV